MTALSSGGVAIPLNQVFLRPQNPKPGFPYTWVELDRSTQAAWGGLQVTPQNAIAVTGTWGFCADADPAGTLAANITAGSATITVSDGSQCGPGDILIAGYGRAAAPFPSDTLGHAGLLGAYTGERMLVTDRSWNDSTFAQSSGCSTVSAADNVLTVTGGTWNVNEMIQLDTERMLILAVDATGLKLTVRRAWDATILAAHGGAEVFVSRTLSVLRGQFGTTAASASGGAALYRHRPPSLVRDLNIAEATNRVLQETSGYARTVGSADSLMPATGAGLADLWDEAETAYGRKHRIRAI